MWQSVRETVAVPVYAINSFINERLQAVTVPVYAGFLSERLEEVSDGVHILNWPSAVIAVPACAVCGVVVS